MNQKNNLNLPRIIGHRGVKNLAPENTIDSILKAIRLGLKWIEVDVKISKDGIPFLLHDDKLDRTTNGSGLASLYNYSEIKKLDAGKFFYNKNTNIYPPTLKEILHICKKYKIGINIELKPNLGLEKKNVEKIIEISKIYKKDVKLYYSSFDLKSCIELKKIIPNSLCGILIDDFINYDLEEILILFEKYNFFSCGLNNELISRELIEKLKNKKAVITVYSSKNITNNEALDLWNLGVDSIFSDDPRNLILNI